MLRSPHTILLPPGSTLTAVHHGNDDSIVLGTAQGVVYVVTHVGAIISAFATHSGGITHLAYHKQLRSVLTVERTPDDSGKYDTHSLHVYKCEPVECDAGETGEDDARIGVAADLTLSAPALDLNVCPVTGRAVVLLRNGVLLVLDCTAAGFELILELEMQGRQLVAAALYGSYLCIASTVDARIVRLHRDAGEDGAPMCDTDCLQSSCDMVYDDCGRLLTPCLATAAASLPAVTAADPCLPADHRRILQSCVVAENSFNDPAVSISYNTSAGYGCTAAQSASPVVAFMDFEPTDEVVSVQFAPCTGRPEYVECLIATKYQATSFLLHIRNDDSDEQVPLTKPRAYLMSVHRWLSCAAVSVVMHAGMLAAATQHGEIEMWSHTSPLGTGAGRLHAELQRRLLFHEPVLLHCQDVSACDTEGVLRSQHVVGAAPVVMTPTPRGLVVSRPVAPWSREFGLAEDKDDNEDDGQDRNGRGSGGVLVFEASSILESLTALTEQLQDATFGHASGEEEEDAVSAASSDDDSAPSFRFTSPRTSKLSSLCDDVSFIGEEGFARLLQLWMLATAEAQRMWENVLDAQYEAPDERTRDDVTRLRTAARLAQSRLQCWKSMKLFSREAAYFLWVDVPPALVFPSHVTLPDAKKPLGVELVLALVAPLVTDTPDSLSTATAMSFIAEVKRLVSEPAKVPSWLQQLVHADNAAAMGLDSTALESLWNLLELISVYPLESLTIVAQLVNGLLPESCRGDLHADAITTSASACKHSGPFCSACLCGHLVAALCAWRLGRFEPALSNLLSKPFCHFPDAAVAMLKASGPCRPLISLWKDLLAAIGSDLERQATVDGGDHSKTAFRAALSYLAVHVDSSAVLAMLPKSEAVSEFRDILAGITAASLAATAIASTVEDIEALLSDDATDGK